MNQNKLAEVVIVNREGAVFGVEWRPNGKVVLAMMNVEAADAVAKLLTPKPKRSQS